MILLNAYVVLLLKLGLCHIFFQVVNRLEQGSDLLRMHFVQCFDLLVAPCVSLLKLLILFLEDGVLSLSLIVVLLEKIDQFVLRLVLVQLHIAFC